MNYVKFLFILAILLTVSFAGAKVVEDTLKIVDVANVGCDSYGRCKGKLEKVYDENNGAVCYVATMNSSSVSLAISCIK